MPGLPDDGVDDVKPRDLELWSALLYELLDGLDDVLVELDRLDRRLGDRGHARLEFGGFSSYSDDSSWLNAFTASILRGLLFHT